MKQFLWAATAAAALVCAACGSSGGRYPVRGKVFHKGEPAAGAAVYFHRKGVEDRLHDSVLQGIVQPDGSFDLVGPAGIGALPGEYIVLVEWKVGAGQTPGRSPGLTAPDRFQGRYLRLETPLLHAEVKPTTNTLPPFELK